MDLKDRLHKHIMYEPNTGCWLWVGSISKTGYGRIIVNQNVELAHRVSYSLFKGFDLKGMSVLHRCDTPCCINPDHLFTGTQQDNVSDSVKKDRHQRGMRHSKAKLEDVHIKIIRECDHLGFSRETVRSYFKIGYSTLLYIVTKKTWKHII